MIKKPPVIQMDTGGLILENLMSEDFYHFVCSRI